MQVVTTIGLDIAKSVFQVHVVDAQGTIAIRRPLKRRQVLPFFKKLPPCLVGIEAVLRRISSATGARLHGASDAAGVREALRQKSEKRCCRCRGDLRSRHATEHAFRGDKDA